MVKQAMRIVGVLFITTNLLSCQKELNENAYNYCPLDAISVFEGTNPLPAKVIRYRYDQQTRWPSEITIEMPSVGFSRTIRVEIKGNTAILSGVGTLSFDNANRVTQLHIETSIPGIRPGEYFYGYNGSGYLEERLADFGGTDLERTIFKNSGEGFAQYTVADDFNNPYAAGSFRYHENIQIRENADYNYGDIFPELFPFFSMVQIGRLNNLPLERIEGTVISPAPVARPFQYAYNGYELNANGAMTGFDVEGSPSATGAAIVRKVRFKYACE